MSEHIIIHKDAWAKQEDFINKKKKWQASCAPSSSSVLLLLLRLILLPIQAAVGPLMFRCFGFVRATTWQQRSNLTPSAYIKNACAWSYFCTSKLRGFSCRPIFSHMLCFFYFFLLTWNAILLLQICFRGCMNHYFIHYRWWFGSGSWANCACCQATWILLMRQCSLAGQF